VRAKYHNPSGQVIKLEGVSHPREESGAAHTEVVLTGRVPERAALGTYECRSVQGLTGDRNGAPIFEDPDFSICVVERPFHAKAFHAQRGREFLGLEPAYRAESLKSPGKRAVVTKEGNKSTHEPTRRSSGWC